MEVNAMQNSTSGPVGILNGQTLSDLPADSRLTPLQAAQILNISKDTLQIWRSTGRHNLPYVKVGGRVNYRVGDIRDWLTRRSRTHTGEVAA
jgi:hypothetical protein